ncbi:MAG: TrpR YerC/YecD [Lachnospiraceae bacterium]|nr:TrpR YerC/YecD [Lachnospiraceae bacterium]
MNKKLRGSQVDRFLEAILSLKTKEEARKYLEDVCTVNEILTLAQRHAVAEMLRRGVTYVEITEKTGASTATISRVNRSLSLGGEGYDIVLSRLSEGK